MARILVTGGAGFTGRYLTDLLARRGNEVHTIGHAAPQAPMPSVQAVHVADLSDFTQLASVVDTVRPEQVVHLAAIAFVAHGNVEELYRTNIVGTRNLLEALSRLSAVPSSVIVASSANVYGNAREGVLDESMPLSPANDYGVSKTAAEHVTRLYEGRLPLTVVRPFNYTGVGQSPNFLIPKIVDHARRRAEVIELGNLDVARDFSDVRTVVDAYARLLEAPAAAGGTFNICSGRATTLREVIDLAAAVSGHRMEVRVNPAFVRADEVRTLSGSAARLEALIGPLRRIPLEHTLRWMLEG